jgi:cytochrome bd ubiquinol oxidase subunit II
MDLQAIWFVLIAVLFTGYVLLDGFDLGVGILHLTARSESERQIGINSIAPVWDGNEVWLLTAGGALFAAFPPVYASVASGFYLAVMLLLLALMVRAVALEFRNKVESARWRTIADWAFSIASLLTALLLGVAFGNVVRGVPLDSVHVYRGSFLGLLNPFALLVGLTGVALLSTHGAAWLIGKSTGELSERMWRLVPRLWSAFVLAFLGLTIWALAVHPHLFSARATFIFALFLLLLFAAFVFVFRALQSRSPRMLFAGTSATIVSLLGLTATNLYPVILRSLTDEANSLTIRNASSSPYTLSTMFTIALIGMPLVLVYTVVVYRIFRGKVEAGDAHY